MVRRSSAAAVAAVLVLPALAAAGAPEEAFERACAAYEQGKWAEAADGFRGVLRYGIRDARVEYNLAGAEYKQGRLGQAVLHYERARRLDPSDPDTEANLELVRAKLRDVVPPDPAESGVLGWIRDVQGGIGAGPQALLTLAALTASALLIGLGASRPGGFTPGRSWLLGATFALAIVAGISWRSTEGWLYDAGRAVVLVPAVEVLAGPGLENASLFTLHEGTTVTIGAEREGWVQVALPSGLSGWMARDAAERI